MQFCNNTSFLLVGNISLYCVYIVPTEITMIMMLTESGCVIIATFCATCLRKRFVTEVTTKMLSLCLQHALQQTFPSVSRLP